ncbi:MAG TPA: 50S ribosomal protein L4 [Ignavibacteriales bacterium]|nr:50S ribosomal protein L4 [Ignavibacteriales bacterium]HOL80178.1 50S ribosomal protein L4 [Ignavibacteriales bacterium]HOM64460.1 50S ribosomal protein L4 [Ignavibacteriales bacterium]HPD68275.1 50S ribosomal protein L4 [Ignavibacteriales bacterium]HPP32367.1 50S ribosomal protein L4 [Ignavibacteriales bacterium]
MKFDVLKIDGSQSGNTVEISDEIISREPNNHVIYLDVKAYLANQRQGTHKTKEKSEVAGSTRKLWRQKGRGTARVGQIRTPLWVGGGTVFGPRPRDYRQYINKKVKKLARQFALINKIKSEQFLVIEDIQLSEVKTKNIANILKSLNLTDKKVTLLTNNPDVYVAGRNIEKLNIINPKDANTYTLLNNQKLVVEKSALDDLIKIL